MLRSLKEFDEVGAREAPAKDQVHYLDGNFDVPALCRVSELISKMPPTQVVLDFHNVHFCEPFALVRLFELINRSEGAIRARGLCRHHELLLGYHGLLNPRGELP